MKNNKKILIISKTQIKENFKKELYNHTKEKYKKKKSDIVQCTGLSYELPEKYKYLSLDEKKKKVNDMIKKYYKFVPYLKFTNNINKLLNWDGELETLTQNKINKLKNIYSNSIIIIDEVQNIRPNNF